MLRTRIPPPIVGVLIAASMRAVADVPPAWVIPTPLARVVAIALVVIAVTVDVSALVAFGRARTTANPFRPERATRMVTGGVYRITRNPMYLGMALLLSAWAIRQASAWALLGPVAFVAYITHFQIRPEEAALTGKFGEEYVAYTRRVRRWI
ncbi:MAG: hypothetical protein AMXMBFR57_21630 [Acidimicrobiia bacterium]